MFSQMVAAFTIFRLASPEIESFDGIYQKHVFYKAYFVLIDPITSNEGNAPDYMIEVSWNNSSKEWIQILKQFSADGLDERILGTWAIAFLSSFI
jgi:hypothetical protein